MSLHVEILPTLQAAEEQLADFISTARTDSLTRVTVLVGSNVQRIYFRRMLARNLGQTANVHFHTPVDLAMEIRRTAMPPQRRPLPDGGDTLLVEGILRRLHEGGQIRRLDPAVRGVADAVAASLTDLREGYLTPKEFSMAVRRNDDHKLHDLTAIYHAFDSEIAQFIDRPNVYLDAVDPVSVPPEAIVNGLGCAPLAVIGLYDATPVQIELIRRCAGATAVQVFLVAQRDAAFDFTRGFAEALRDAGATFSTSEEETSESSHGPHYQYFSAPSRQSEAEEITRRILALARDHTVPFNEIAVLHRLDQSYDDLLCAALERGGVPVYRATGRPVRHTAAGRAALVLLDLMLDTPVRHRLLEFLANPALRETLPTRARSQPMKWERISKKAGMVAGWRRFLTQLNAYCEPAEDPEQSTADLNAARDLRAIVVHLRTAAAEPKGFTTWAEYSGWFLTLTDRFLGLPTERETGPTNGPGDDGEERGADSLSAIRDRISQLTLLDDARLPVSPEQFREAASRAIRKIVLKAGDFQRNGSFVGNVTAARSLRFEAVFLAECAERIFPPLIRQDPLLLDSERQRLNRRLHRTALPLKRGRLQEEQLLFALVEQSAKHSLTFSWARRTSATGAPRLPSSFLRDTLPEKTDRVARARDLRPLENYTHMPAGRAGCASTLDQIASGEWTAITAALDEADLRLGILAAAPLAAPDSLRALWPDYARYDAARHGRNALQFSKYDGAIPPAQLRGDPLARVTSATALETYAICPYRYFLSRILRVGAVPEPGEALEMTPLDRGTLVHTILERWVQDALDQQADWSAYLNNKPHLMQIAEEAFQDSGLSGLAGLPATWNIVRQDILADLRQLLSIERERADAGYRPLAVEWRFEDLPFDVPSGGHLLFNGRVDRVDRGPDGLVAIDYKTGAVRKRAEHFRNGSALQLPVYAHAIARDHDTDPEAVRAEYWYATRRGEFHRSSIQGADILQDDRFHGALATITGGIRGGRFFPNPGDAHGQRRRPNCTFCDYHSVCTTDVDLRVARKARHDQDTVRAFRTMQAQR